jgi:hypothetical protein
MWCVWGRWGGWAVSCVLGQVVAVVGCEASCGVLAIGVWVGVAIVVVGWGSVT